jgi:hypothetical protein
MDNNRPFVKPAPAIVYYLFFAFISGFGVYVTIINENPPFSSIFGPIIFFIGCIFLLEPLNRKKNLPQFLSVRYERATARLSRRKNVRKAIVVIRLILVVGTLVCFLSPGIGFPRPFPPIAIYSIGVFSLISIAVIFSTISFFINESHWLSKQHTRFIAFTTLGLDSSNLGSNLSSYRSFSNFYFYLLIFVVGMFVSFSISSEYTYGAVGLVVMWFLSFCQIIVFRREEKARAKVEAELKAAHDMQMGLMPKEDPKIDRFDISGICLPANEVGGDFFDYVWLDDVKSLLGISVADVSGKAMKAAMTAVMTSGMVYREIGTNETPKSILKKINRPMYLKTDKNVFTALSFAVINPKQKELTLSNAGQMTPLLKRGDTIRSIKVEGPRLPLGIKEEVEYDETTEQLQSGDVLFLFTDGIIEAKNNKEELWGFERMEQTVKDLPQTMNAKEMGETLIAEANKFAGTAMQQDDMTIVVMRVL